MHFHCTLLAEKVSEKPLWVERPKLHTYYSFQAQECFAYFLLGRKYSDFSKELEAVSYYLVAQRKKPKRKAISRVKKKKKASRGFDPEQPEVWVRAERGGCIGD